MAPTLSYKQKKTIKEIALKKEAEELTLQDYAVLGNWSDDYHSYFCLFCKLSSINALLDEGEEDYSVIQAKEELERLLSEV